MKKVFWGFLILAFIACKGKEKEPQTLTVIMHMGKEYRKIVKQKDKIKRVPEGFSFVDENGRRVKILEDHKGKILVIGYIYTHCPDVCPMITQNMKKIYDLVGKNKDVVFLSVTLDPMRDKPDVLREYKDVHEINAGNWKFLTGDEGEIEKFLKYMGIVWEKYDAGNTYFLAHTDRIHLVDKNGYVVGYLQGSTVDPKEVANFLRELLRP
jgi:Uncharacterized protein SCO1/SenC/PrrC, involved in biogenesis of respiratory and photosynthetic systems